MNKLRAQYLYRLVGTIRQKKPRQSLKGQFYQLHILCENLPHLTKIFVFDDKLAQPQIRTTISEDHCFNSKYLFYCRNYSGHYYLVDWKELEKDENPLQDPQENHDTKWTQKN